MHTGSRGHEHVDILRKHHPEIFLPNGDVDIPDHIQTGFYDPKYKKFHRKDVPGREYTNVSSFSLMSKVQRMRRFGTESQARNT